MLVFFLTTGPRIKYTECISGSAEFSPSGSSRESQILSPVDATASTSLWIQPPHLQEERPQAPAAEAVDSEALIYSHTTSLCFREGFSTVIGLFFLAIFLSSSQTHHKPFALIVFPFLPLPHHHRPDNVYLMLNLDGQY